jgi:hypothetical protein
VRLALSSQRASGPQSRSECRRHYRSTNRRTLRLWPASDRHPEVMSGDETPRSMQLLRWFPGYCVSTLVHVESIPVTIFAGLGKIKMSVSPVGKIAGWAWACIAGGGGLWLLCSRGPWPPTNGWFALFSGLAACPLLPWLLKRYAGMRVSGSVQFVVALLFFVAGRIALTVWPHQ